MAGHPTFAGVCKVGTEKARLSMLVSFHTLCKCLSRSKMQSDCLNCHGEQERKAKVRLSNSGSCIAIGQKARHPAGISSMISAILCKCLLQSWVSSCGQTKTWFKWGRLCLASPNSHRAAATVAGAGAHRNQISSESSGIQIPSEFLHPP